MPAFTALFALRRIFAIAAPDNPPKPVIGRVPHLPAKNLTAGTADDPASKGIAGCRILKLLNAVLQGEITPAFHFKLNRFPHLFVDNGGMSIFWTLGTFLFCHLSHHFHRHFHPLVMAISITY